MTKYPLEWGWDTPEASKSSTSSEWKPKPTLIGGHSDDIKVAAAGDLKCEGVCSQGGSWGTTAMYEIGRRYLCRNCGVKEIGVENLSGAEQDEHLAPFEIKER
jgi:hypothetical protein